MGIQATLRAAMSAKPEKPKPSTKVDVTIGGQVVEIDVPLDAKDPNFGKEIDKRARAIERDMFKKGIIKEMVGKSNIKANQLKAQSKTNRKAGDMAGAGELLARARNLETTGVDVGAQDDDMSRTSTLDNLPIAGAMARSNLGRALTMVNAASIGKAQELAKPVFNVAGNIAKMGSVAPARVLGAVAKASVDAMSNVPDFKGLKGGGDIAKAVINRDIPEGAKTVTEMFNPFESSIAQLLQNPVKYVDQIGDSTDTIKAGNKLAVLEYALLVGGPALDVLGGFESASALSKTLGKKLGAKAAREAKAEAIRQAKIKDLAMDPEQALPGASFRPSIEPNPGVTFRQPKAATPNTEADAAIASIKKAIGEGDSEPNFIKAARERVNAAKATEPETKPLGRFTPKADKFDDTGRAPNLVELAKKNPVPDTEPKPLGKFTPVADEAANVGEAPDILGIAKKNPVPVENPQQGSSKRVFTNTRDGSWVAVSKETLEPIVELSDINNANRVNQEKYYVFPYKEYVRELQNKTDKDMLAKGTDYDFKRGGITRQQLESRIANREADPSFLGIFSKKTAKKNLAPVETPATKPAPKSELGIAKIDAPRKGSQVEAANEPWQMTVEEFVAKIAKDNNTEITLQEAKDYGLVDQWKDSVSQAYRKGLPVSDTNSSFIEIAADVPIAISDKNGDLITRAVARSKVFEDSVVVFDGKMQFNVHGSQVRIATKTELEKPLGSVLYKKEIKGKVPEVKDPTDLLIARLLSEKKELEQPFYRYTKSRQYKLDRDSIPEIIRKQIEKIDNEILSIRKISLDKSQNQSNKAKISTPKSDLAIAKIDPPQVDTPAKALQEAQNPKIEAATANPKTILSEDEFNDAQIAISNVRSELSAAARKLQATIDQNTMLSGKLKEDGLEKIAEKRKDINKLKAQLKRMNADDMPTSYSRYYQKQVESGLAEGLTREQAATTLGTRFSATRKRIADSDVKHEYSIIDLSKNPEANNAVNFGESKDFSKQHVLLRKWDGSWEVEDFYSSESAALKSVKDDGFQIEKIPKAEQSLKSLNEPKFIENARKRVEAFDKGTGKTRGRKGGSAIDPAKALVYLVDNALIGAYEGTGKVVALIKKLAKEAGIGPEIVARALKEVEIHREYFGDKFDDVPAVKAVPDQPPTTKPAPKPEPTATAKPVAEPKPEPKPVAEPKPESPSPTPKPIKDLEVKNAPNDSNTVGIKNSAQDIEIERGFIRSLPGKSGMTDKEIDDLIESQAGRTDYDGRASSIANGESFNAESFAVALQGDRLKRIEVQTASRNLSDAIARGASQAEIDNLKIKFDAALESRQDYLQKIQRGKSEWSNVGRVLQRMVSVDTGDVASVLAEASARKGSKLTDVETEQLRALVEKTSKEKAELEARVQEITKKLEDLQVESEAKFDELLKSQKASGKSGSSASAARRESTKRALSTINAAAVKLLKSTSKLSSGIDPTLYTEFIKEVAPAVTQIIKNYIDEGVDILDVAVRKTLDKVNGDLKDAGIDIELKDTDVLEILAGKHTEQQPMANATKIMLKFRAEAKKIVDADIIAAQKEVAAARRIVNAEKRRVAGLAARAKLNEARKVAREEAAAFRKAQRLKTKAARQEYIEWWNKTFAAQSEKQRMLDEKRAPGEAARAEAKAKADAERSAFNQEVSDYNKAQKLDAKQSRDEYVAWWNSTYAAQLEKSLKKEASQQARAEAKKAMAELKKIQREEAAAYRKSEKLKTKEARDEYIEWWNSTKQAQDEKIFRSVDTARARARAKLEDLQRQLEEGVFTEKKVNPAAEARKLDRELQSLKMLIKSRESEVLAAIEAQAPVERATRIGNVLTEVALMNPISRVKDTAGNLGKVTGFLAGNIPQAVIDAALAKATGTPAFTTVLTPGRLRSIFSRAGIRTKSEMRMVMQGRDADTIKKFGSNRGMFSKLAGATDVPFRAIYYETFVDQAANQAARIQLGKGAKAADIKRIREDIVRNIENYPEIEANAHEFSLQMTYNGENWVSEIGASVKRGPLKGNKTAGLAYDVMVGRFGKVITNVAIDNLNRTPVGVINGLVKALQNPKTLTSLQRATAVEMIEKGLVGSALTYMFYNGYASLPKEFQGTIKGTRDKYVDFGDIGQIGGPLGPALLGAALRKAQELKASEREALVTKTLLNMPFETPFATNIKDILSAASGQTSPKQFAAKKISNMVIPGGVRDAAKRSDVEPGATTMDILLGRKQIERDKYPDETVRERVKGRGYVKSKKTTTNFSEIMKGEFASKIPIARQTLPKKKP